MRVDPPRSRVGVWQCVLILHGRVLGFSGACWCLSGPCWRGPVRAVLCFCVSAVRGVLGASLEKGEGGLWPVAKVPLKISKADNAKELALGGVLTQSPG